MTAPQIRECTVRQAMGVVALQDHPAGVGLRQQPENMHEGGFTRSRVSDERGDTSRRDSEIDVFEDVDPLAAQRIGLAYPTRCQ